MSDRDAAVFFDDFVDEASQTHLEPLDTLRSDLLPSIDNIELAYRATLPEVHVRYQIVLYYSLIVPLATVVVTAIVRVMGLFVWSELSCVLFVIAGIAAAFITLTEQTTPKSVLKFALFGPAAWLGMAGLSLIDDSVAIGGLMIAVVLVLILQSDVIRSHQLLWWAAEPKLSSLIRDEYRSRWISFVSRLKTPATRRHLLAASIFGTISSCLVAFAISTAPVRPATGSLAILAFCLSVICATVLQSSSVRDCIQQWKLTIHAISIWVSYSPHHTAAAVFRGPGIWGKVDAPRISFVATLCVTTCVIAPAGYYFPLTIFQSDTWTALSDSQIPPPPSKLPSRDYVEKELSPETLMLYDRLPGWEQGAFLDRWRRIHLEVAQQQHFVTFHRRMMHQLNQSPEGWMRVLASSGLLVRAPGLWTVLCSTVLSVVIPGLLFLSICVAVGGPSLLAAHRTLAENPEGFDSEWDGYVDALQSSANPVAKKSLWLGVNEFGDYPFLFPCELLREHAHILGDTGSGKTARALAPMISQLTRMSGRDRNSSIVVIDLKGDQALLNGTRLDAEQNGLQFRWFTNQYALSTYAFNPFMQPYFAKLSPGQRAEILMDALSLQHGEGYGRSFYSKTNRRLLSRALEAFGDRVQSFADLDRVFQPKNRDLSGRKFKISPTEARDGSELFATIESLAKLPQLNVTPAAVNDRKVPASAVESQIDIADVFSQPTVLYFYLPAALEAGAVREIGKLALFGLLSASTVNESSDRKPNQVYLFIDEFQQIVAENLEIVLRQARSKNIAAILANQTVSDLKTSSVDLVPTVRANTRLKQFFASTDPVQQDDIVRSSGKTFRDYASLFDKDSARITQNEVMRITDDPALSIVHLSRGGGFAQFGGFPFVVRTSFHISGDEYKRRESMAWPESEPGTFKAKFSDSEKAEDEAEQTEAVPAPKPEESTDSKPAPKTKSKKKRKKAARKKAVVKAEVPSKGKAPSLLAVLDGLVEEHEQREQDETQRAQSRQSQENSNATEEAD